MYLSSLYSNDSERFGPIHFGQGLNVILGEIRLPENKDRDTHNLGKSILARLIDFCFLSRRNKGHFLFRHFDLFSSFVFFLEIHIEGSSFVTVRRAVEKSSKVSFMLHERANQDFSGINLEDWTHHDVPFDRARQLLDGLLNWQSISPWSYRMALGYQLRGQNDYLDVFQLRKFASSHSDWKPFLAHLLGIDSSCLSKAYEQEDFLAEARVERASLDAQIGLAPESLEDIEGILFLKKEEAEKRRRFLGKFDFSKEDLETTERLVNDINYEISRKNKQRYRVRQNLSRVEESLSIGGAKLKLDRVKKLFEEVEILFPDQLQKDFTQLLEFNEQIGKERSAYLEEERKALLGASRDLDCELERLQKKRSESLKGIAEEDPFEKYRKVSSDLVELQSDIRTLEKSKESIDQLKALNKKVKDVMSRVEALHEEVREAVDNAKEDPEGRFSTIRRYFSEFIEAVLGRKALLKANVNSSGHVEFDAVILDDAGDATSADDGHTYKKLLCIAFDLSVARAYLPDRYPKFTYHDGVFESLDNRKKQNLLQLLRRYSELGLQVLITSIDSDFPDSTDEGKWLSEAEVVLRLHDQGPSGRLFRMKPW
jgi:uncharacterized protein YydD (DUF2326 family)